MSGLPDSYQKISSFFPLVKLANSTIVLQKEVLKTDT